MRTFLAIDLPECVRSAIYDLGMKMPGNFTPVPEKNIHITLHFLGDIDEKKSAEVKDIMDLISPQKFEATAKGISFFVGGRIQAVFAKILDDGASAKIRADLGGQLIKKGFQIDSRIYVPHSTFARMKLEAPTTKDFIKNNAETFFGSFTANSISLKTSVLSEKGVIYKNLYERELS